MSNTPQRAYPALDGLRGLAAIFVMLFHTRGDLALAPFGYRAVDVFFIMSGFVIAHAYDHRIAERGALWFVRLRLIRFYPLLLLGLLIGLVTTGAQMLTTHASCSVGDVLAAFGLNALFLPAPPSGLSSGYLFPLDGPAWSLMFELAINLLYALAFRWLSTRVLVCLVVASAAGVVVACFSPGGLVSAGTDWPHILGGVARVGFGFPLGVLLYRLPLPSWRNGWVAGLAMLAAFTLGGSPLADAGFVLFVAPLVVIACANSRPPMLRLCALLGGLSYALYAIHQPVLLLERGVQNHFGLPGYWLGYATMAALVLLCPLLERFYDQPVRRWMTAGRTRVEAQTVAP